LLRLCFWHEENAKSKNNENIFNNRFHMDVNNNYDAMTTSVDGPSSDFSGSSVFGTKAREKYE